MEDLSQKQIEAKLPFVDVTKEFAQDEVLKIKGKDYVVAAVIGSSCYVKIEPKARRDARKALVAEKRRPGAPRE